MKWRILLLLSGCLLTAGLAACNWGGGNVDLPSSPSSAPPASAPESGPTETQRASILDAVNGVLDKYRSGEFPQEYRLNTDWAFFLDSFPADSVLPESVSWEDLTVNITWDAPDNMYYTNSMDVALPLENDYRMNLWGGEESDGSWKIMNGSIRDLREARQFGRIETESGEFTDVSADRLKLSAQVKNLDFPGLPADNNGRLSVDLVHGWVVLQLYFSDNGYFSATTYQTPPVVRGSLSPGPDENELYNQLLNCGALLRNAVSAQTLVPAEREALTQRVNEILDGYREGRYPLPILQNSEYFLNDPFPNGVSIPDKVERLRLSPLREDGPVSHLVRLPLDGGYQAVFYFFISSAPVGERSFTLPDLRFEDPDGKVLPSPQP